MRKGAFTLIELICVIAIISILAALLLPGLAQGKARAQRVQCINQLRQIGLGFQIFAHEHNNRFPMQVPIENGGSLEFVKNGYQLTGEFYFTFHHFKTLASELVTPRILVCPADKQRQMADDFIFYDTDNVSYALGDDADETKPGNILSADRSMTGFEFSALHDNTACYTIAAPNGGKNARWDAGLTHGANSGNLVLTDGSAHTLNNLRLVETVRSIATNDTIDGTLRFYVP